MKKFKMLIDGTRIILLRWVADGKLFGADWETIAIFDNTDDNTKTCKTIIRLMNECDTRSNHLKK